MMGGLGLLDRRERAAFRTLPLSAQLVILDELAYDPSQAEAIRGLLREPDPERAIADQIAAEVTAATYSVPLADVGMGRSWKKAFKKVVSKVVEAPKKVYEKAVEKINVKRVVAYALALPTAGASLLLTPKGQAALKKTKEYAKVYGPTALTIAGIVAAPFTGGASLALPALVQGYGVVRANRAKARDLERQGKAEAAEVAEIVAQQERDSMAYIDSFYRENPNLFANTEYTLERWGAMSLDEKYDAAERLLKAIEEVGQDVADGYESAAADSGASPGWPGGDASISTAEARFRVVVDGKALSASPSTLEDALAKAETVSASGSRVEIFDRGVSLGLWIKTGAGLIKVPADQLSAVRGLSPDQSKQLVARSEQAASGAKGGFPIWILAAPVVIYAATR